MQIQLKQTEIEAALKLYISSQGISLANKEVTIDFTSGRKENGLSADVAINAILEKEATNVVTAAVVTSTDDTAETSAPAVKPPSLFNSPQ